MKLWRILPFIITTILLFANTHAYGADPEQIMGADECAECHEESMDVWKKTKHQKNFKDLSKNKDAKSIASKMGIKRVKDDDALCASCHYTIGLKSGKPRVIAGVSCESCHGPAKEWINVHNDFGGKGIKASNESPAHKTKRESLLEQHGMIRKDNVYGWANNCMNCHMIANEKLVNIGGHSTGSDFKLSKRTQGEIRHYPKADIDQLRFNNMIGYAVELETGLRALANSSSTGKFSSEMQKRTASALNNLSESTSYDSSGLASQSVKLAKSASIKGGNKQLETIANAIAVNTMKAVQKKNGYPYAASKLKSVSTPKPGKAKPAPAAPKPISKPKPEPVKQAIQQTAPKPKVAAAPPKPSTVVAHVKPAPVPSVQTVAAEKTQAVSTDKDDSSPASAITDLYRVTTPTRNALCNTLTPWALGRRALSENNVLSKDGCIGIEIKTTQPAELFIIIETITGSTRLLMPNQCGIANMSNNRLQANKNYILPVNKNQSASALQLSEVADLYRVYSVVVKQTGNARLKVTQLASQLDSICTPGTKSTSGLQQKLENLKQQHPDELDWQAITINQN